MKYKKRTDVNYIDEWSAFWQYIIDHASYNVDTSSFNAFIDTKNEVAFKRSVKFRQHGNYHQTVNEVLQKKQRYNYNSKHCVLKLGKHWFRLSLGYRKHE